MNSEQFLELGYKYGCGIGVEKDEKKAFEYFMKAAELGNSTAMHNIGFYYKYGIGVKRNYQESFQYYKKSADLNNAAGMCNVGSFYENGRGVERDYNKAFEYYEKSANMGCKCAMYNVAHFYRNGVGTKKDIQNAIYWFSKCRSLLKANKSPCDINPGLKKILDDERFKLSWIDYYEFRDIGEVGKGGFATVYYALWEDKINNMWINVALKVIRNSNENMQEFIQEMENYCEIGYKNPSFLKCFGVSKKNNGDYVIVLDFASEGSLKGNLLQVSQLEWKDKLNLLHSIALDLESIHLHELVHRDLHSGNILQSRVLHNAYITDLGLSRKVKGGKICGVLPYIAPEVLVGKPFTKASDIYSLGVIMTEIATGQRAFDGMPFNSYLALRIINGSRPKCLGPDCYIKLAMKCMDSDLYKRPTATEIIETITYWFNEMSREDDNEIKKQFLEANKIKLEPIKPIHSHIMYTSKIYDIQFLI